MAKRGRRSLRDEVIQADVINLSWLTVRDALHSKKFTDEEKLKISIEIVKKTCPQQVNLDGKITWADIIREAHEADETAD